MSKKNTGRCAFCGKEVPYEQLFQGTDGKFICFECIENAHAILEQQYEYIEDVDDGSAEKRKQRQAKDRAEAAQSGIINNGKLVEVMDLAGNKANQDRLEETFYTAAGMDREKIKSILELENAVYGEGGSDE